MTKIIVVEDEIISAMALQKDLKDLGHEVCRLAASGHKAIQIAEHQKPDVALMDINLRGKLNGFETAEILRSRFGTQIIFMSGYPLAEVKEFAGAAEPAYFLLKPIGTADIEKAIKSILHKKPAA